MERIQRFANSPIIKDGIPIMTGVISLITPAIYVAYQTQQNVFNIKNLTEKIEKKEQKDDEERKQLISSFQKYQKDTVEAIENQLIIRDNRNDIKTKSLISDHSNSERWFNLGLSFLTVASIGAIISYK